MEDNYMDIMVALTEFHKFKMEVKKRFVFLVDTEEFCRFLEKMRDATTAEEQNSFIEDFKKTDEGKEIITILQDLSLKWLSLSALVSQHLPDKIRQFLDDNALHMFMHISTSDGENRSFLERFLDHIQGLVQTMGNDLIAVCNEEVKKFNSLGDSQLTVH